MLASGLAAVPFTLPSPLAPTVFVVNPWMRSSETSVARNAPIIR